MKPHHTLRRLMLVTALACSTVFLAEQASAFYNPSTGRWLSRDPIEEGGGKNLYGFVNNGPVANLDSHGLNIFAVNVYYEHVPSPSIFEMVSDQKMVKTEVNRILQDCVRRKARKCNAQSVFLNWFPWSRQAARPPLGFTRALFRKIGYTAIVYRNDSQPYAGNTNGDEIWLNIGLIKDQADIHSFGRELTLATYVAHELFHHALAGDRGHHYAEGYTDALRGQVGGVLSDKCCEEVVDEMDMD